MTDSLKTLNTFKEGAVLFAEIAAPPMNLLGPELVRDLVSLIQRAEADGDVQAGQVGRRLGRDVTWTTTDRATDEAPTHSRTLGQEP